MKRKAFLLQLGLVGFLAAAVSSCGGTSSVISSVAGNSSSVTPSSSAEPSSAEEVKPTYQIDGASNSNAKDYSEIKEAGVDAGATGPRSFVGADYDERTNILGSLEKYAVDESVTGLPLFENSGYVMYQPRVTKGVNTYVTNYGFSVIRDGKLTADLSGETDAKYKKYYHNWEASDPASCNALNSDGSQVSDIMSNMSAGYFGTKLNSGKTGYNWYGVLSSKDAPVCIDAKTGNVVTDVASNTLSTTWRVYVRTGEKGGVNYRTNSQQADRAAFNNTYATLDDYVTPWKVLLDKQNGYYRGGELAGQTGKSGIVGAADYYAATADKTLTAAEKAAAWEKVGIKKGTDATDGDYLQFTFLAPTNRFYAMYNVSESNYEPIPQKYFDLVGAKLYGGYSEDAKTTPVDNMLSVGPYYLETWEKDKLITFKKNEGWWESKANPEIYQIEGIHTAILTAFNSDENAAMKEFLAGKLDAAGIPSDYIADYKTDSRTTQVPGDSVFKLNVNSTSAAQWESLFGEKGSVAQTGKDDYWAVKPWMSNKNFVKGLFYSIDRNAFAEKRGYKSSINFFSDNYMSNPETGTSYNSTEAHKNALSEFWGDSAATGGYSTTLAQAQFTAAIDALIADKSIKAGTADAPTEISITIWWMYQNNITRYGDDIAKYITDNFNAVGLKKGVKLTVKQEAVAVWSDVYYKHLMNGQFDLGFGSVNGNTLDPLNFMEVLKSNNSSGFTLNWGPDTTKLEVKYTPKDGTEELYSFDTLWKAADQGTVIYKGQELPPAYIAAGDKSKFNADHSLSFTCSYEDAKSAFASEPLIESASNLTISIDGIWITNGGSYLETIAAPNADGVMTAATADDLLYIKDVVVNTTDKTVSCTIPVEIINSLFLPKYGYGAFYYGLDYTITIGGVGVTGSAYGEFDFI